MTKMLLFYLKDWSGKWGFKSGYERMEQVLEVGQKWESSFRSRPKIVGQAFKPEKLTKYGHSLK